MQPHDSLLWLPDALRAEGIRVVELDGWEFNQQNYFWTTLGDDGSAVHHGYFGDPNGWMWHHTASQAYTPYVKNSRGQTKANMFFGLWRGDPNNRLYASGEGVATVVMCSGGPANYSSGSGRKDVLRDFVMEDRRFRGPQRNVDDYPKFYGNRFYGNTEIVHPGDGSPLDVGVWRAAYVTASVLSDHFGWSAWRNIGHLDHTRRKVDPRFEQGSPYSIGLLQDAAEGVSAGVVSPPPQVPDSEEYDMKVVKRGDGYKSNGTVKKRSTVKAAQIMLAHCGFADENTSAGACAADGIFGPGTEAAVKGFQADRGLPVDGVVGKSTWEALEGW